MYIARMPERFAIPITPTSADIDGLGHVSNVSYLKWVVEVALAHSAAVGWPVARYHDHGAAFMVRRHEIDYVSQVTLGETLSAETWIETWRPASCIRRTELLRDGKVVVRAATTWAMIGLSSGRPVRISDDLVALFS